MSHAHAPPPRDSSAAPFARDDEHPQADHETGWLAQTRRLEVGYAGRPILPPVDLTLRPGELWAVIGRNGCGKSTLLRTLLGLQSPVAGAIAFADGLRTGYIPQRTEVDQQSPSRVVDIVRSGADVGWDFLRPFSRARHRAAADALEACGAHLLAHRQFRELSEGQKQRVLVARALAANPQLLLLDEPASAMDVHSEHELFELLDRLRRTRPVGILVVSHHVDFTVRHATHLLLLDAEAKYCRCGPVAEVVQSRAFHTRYGVPSPDEFCDG